MHEEAQGFLEFNEEIEQYENPNSLNYTPEAISSCH